MERLRHLLEHRPKGLTLYDLADGLGMTPRSMRRYLAEIGPDTIESVPGTTGRARLWRLRAGEVPRKVELRRTQAYALLAARRVFEPLRGSALYLEIDQAIDRLVAVAQKPGRGPNAGIADARLEDRFLYLPVAPKDYAARTDELDDLFQAVADLRPLRCRYRSASGSAPGAEESVTLHPYALVLHRDAIYCVGWHSGRGEIRTFLLDRMRDTEVSTTERFALPDGFRVDDWFQGEFGIWRSPKRTRVVVDFDAKVAENVRSRRVHPTQKIASIEGGGVRLAMTVGDLRELVSWLLGFGPTARVVEPPELVQMMESELRGALARYDRAARRAR